MSKRRDERGNGKLMSREHSTREHSFDTQRRIVARKSCCENFLDALPLLVGILESQLGMMLFNMGLTWGFTSLGDKSGSLLPSAFMATADEPGSPYYSEEVGEGRTSEALGVARLCEFFFVATWHTSLDPCPPFSVC